MVVDARDDFKNCMEDTEEKQGRAGYETARMQCLANYKRDLKALVPQLNQIYEGYQGNYKATDGSLHSSN